MSALVSFSLSPLFFFSKNYFFPIEFLFSRVFCETLDILTGRDEAEETIRRPKITADEMVLERDSIYHVWNSFLHSTFLRKL